VWYRKEGPQRPVYEWEEEYEITEDKTGNNIEEEEKSKKNFQINQGKNG
jgi:hypothetical protein